MQLIFVIYLYDVRFIHHTQKKHKLIPLGTYYKIVFSFGTKHVPSPFNMPCLNETR